MNFVVEGPPLPPPLPPPQMLPGAAGALSALSRFPLSSGDMMEEEPLYVNAKQYHRILKRRQARARLEAEGKIPKQRQVPECSQNGEPANATPDSCLGLVSVL